MGYRLVTGPEAISVPIRTFFIWTRAQALRGSIELHPEKRRPQEELALRGDGVAASDDLLHKSVMQSAADHAGVTLYSEIICFDRAAISSRKSYVSGLCSCFIRATSSARIFCPSPLKHSIKAGCARKLSTELSKFL